MTKKKVFVVNIDSDRELLKWILESNSDNLEVTFAEKPFERLPRNYEAYLLHLSDINLRDLEDLRKEQPWSWIFAIFGGGTRSITPEERRNIDDIFYNITRSEALYISYKLKNYRILQGEEK